MSKGCLKGYPRDRGRVMELLIGREFLSYPSLIGQLKKGCPLRHPFRQICFLSRFSALVYGQNFNKNSDQILPLNLDLLQKQVIQVWQSDRPINRRTEGVKGKLRLQKVRHFTQKVPGLCRLIDNEQNWRERPHHLRGLLFPPRTSLHANVWIEIDR